MQGQRPRAYLRYLPVKGARHVSEPEVIPLRGNAEVDPKPQPSFLRRWRWPLIVGGPLLIVLVVAYFILTGGRPRTPANAYVRLPQPPAPPPIPARVTAT